MIDNACFHQSAVDAVEEVLNKNTCYILICFRQKFIDYII